MPWDFPSPAKKRPLYLTFHPYLGTRRPELYTSLSPQGLWKDPSNLVPVEASELGQDKFHSVATKTDVLHWDVYMVQQHLPQQPLSKARKLSVLPAALSVDCPWLSLPLSTFASPVPHHSAFPGHQEPSLALHWSQMSDKVSHLIQTTNNRDP